VLLIDAITIALVFTRHSCSSARNYSMAGNGWAHPAEPALLVRGSNNVVRNMDYFCVLI